MVRCAAGERLEMPPLPPRSRLGEDHIYVVLEGSLDVYGPDAAIDEGDIKGSVPWCFSPRRESSPNHPSITAH